LEHFRLTIQNEKAAVMKLSRPYPAAGRTVALMAVILLYLCSPQRNFSQPEAAIADASHRDNQVSILNLILKNGEL